MDIAEACFERLIKHVCEMVLELLCPLNSEEVIAASGQAVKVIGIVSVISIAELVGRILKFQSQVSTYSSTTWIFLHMRPHLVNGIFPWLHSYVCKDAVFWVHQFTKALEEKHMGGEFAFVLVLHTKEHIVVRLTSIFVLDLGD